MESAMHEFSSEPARYRPASPEEILEATSSGLYAGGQEHDACGVGFVAHIAGQKSHGIVEQG
jgi:hypothetical protein